MRHNKEHGVCLNKWDNKTIFFVIMFGLFFFILLIGYKDIFSINYLQDDSSIITASKMWKTVFREYNTTLQWRPLFYLIVYFLTYILKINLIGYRILTLCMCALNGTLVAVAGYKMKLSKSYAFLAGLLFVMNVNLQAGIVLIGVTFQTALGLCACLMSMIFAIEYLNTNKYKYLVCMTIFNVLGTLAYEAAIICVAFDFFLMFFLVDGSFFSRIKYALKNQRYSILYTVVYLVFRVGGIANNIGQANGSYAVSIGKNIVDNLYRGVSSLYIPQYSLIILAVVLCFTLYCIFKKEYLPALFVVIMIVGWMPFVLLQREWVSYYLMYSLIGAALLLAYAVEFIISKKCIVKYIIMPLFSILVIGYNWNYNWNSMPKGWMTTASKCVDNLIDEFSSVANDIPQGSNIYFINFTEDLACSIGFGDVFEFYGMQYNVKFDDSYLKIYGESDRYGKSDSLFFDLCDLVETYNEHNYYIYTQTDEDKSSDSDAKLINVTDYVKNKSDAGTIKIDNIKRDLYIYAMSGCEVKETNELVSGNSIADIQYMDKGDLEELTNMNFQWVLINMDGTLENALLLERKNSDYLIRHFDKDISFFLNGAGRVLENGKPEGLQIIRENGQWRSGTPILAEYDLRNINVDDFIGGDDYEISKDEYGYMIKSQRIGDYLGITYSLKDLVIDQPVMIYAKVRSLSADNLLRLEMYDFIEPDDTPIHTLKSIEQKDDFDEMFFMSDLHGIQQNDYCFLGFVPVSFEDAFIVRDFKVVQGYYFEELLGEQ